MFLGLQQDWKVGKRVDHSGISRAGFGNWLWWKCNQWKQRVGFAGMNCDCQCADLNFSDDTLVRSSAVSVPWTGIWFDWKRTFVDGSARTSGNCLRKLLPSSVDDAFVSFDFGLRSEQGMVPD